MTTLDHARELARVVYGDPVDRVVDPPVNRARWRVELPELLALAANLDAAGYPVGDVITKVEAISTAVTVAVTPDAGRWLTGDLLALGPDVVADRVRQAGLDQAAYIEMARVGTDVEHRLAADAAASLRENSDKIIIAMRKKFDPAVTVVQAAADAGLTPHTDTAALLDTAEPAVIEAYRALGPATAELDRIAALRNSMITVAGIGPVEYPLAALVTDVPDLPTLDGAGSTWKGETETVQVDLPFGSSLARVRRPRLGGPWLALLTGGYTLRLNTATEAEAVVAAASAG